MESKKYKITMGNPCNFGWQNMTPEGNGRHCSQCDKVVVDFTSMSDEALVNYLLTHKNVCGHFKKSQLNRPVAIHVQKRKLKIHWPAIAAMLVAGMFHVSTSYSQANVPSSTTGYEISVDREEINTAGKIAIDGDSTVTIKVRVIDAKSKKLVNGATVEIPGIGSYTSKNAGIFKVSFCTKQLPAIIRVNASAYSYYFYSLDVSLADFIKNPVYNIELWFDDPNMHVDGGDMIITPYEPEK